MNLNNIKDEKEFLRKFFSKVSESRGNGFRQYSGKKNGGAKKRPKSWMVNMLNRNGNVSVLEEDNVR